MTQTSAATGLAPRIGAHTADVARRSGLLWAGAAASQPSFTVLGLSFANVRLGEAVTDLVSAALQRRRQRVVFVNAHVMNMAWRDDAYRSTVASADVRLADGSGLAIAARMAGRAFVDNVNGTDMLEPLCAEALRRGVSLYLLGGSAGAAAGSAATMARRGYGAAIAGTHHGFFNRGSADEARVIEAINASGASIVLVGLGVPLQDVWIERNASRLQAPVLIGVGGLFDFFSGRVSRAPPLLRSIGMEWMWRLAMEPARMWRRYVIGNATFLAHAAREAIAARMATRPIVDAR